MGPHFSRVGIVDVNLIDLSNRFSTDDIFSDFPSLELPCSFKQIKVFSLEGCRNLQNDL
jgi:hypothetical protein